MKLHSLEKLIKKDNENRTFADVADEMAEIKLCLMGWKRGVSHTEKEYDEKFNSLKSNYQSNFSKYTNEDPAKSVTPEKIEIFWLMSKAIGCTIEKLVEIFYPNYIYDTNLHKNNQSKIKNIAEAAAESIIELPQKVSDLLGIKYLDVTMFREKGCKFIILVNEHEAIYTKNPNTLKSTKNIILLCLEDDIASLKFFDYYRCIREEDDVKINYSDNISGISRKKRPASDDNLVTLNFEKPLKKNEIVEFNISYFYEGIFDIDMNFHYIWTRWETLLLKLKVVPANPENIQMAEYREHRNKGCPDGIEEEIEGKTKEVFLKGEPKCFEETVKPEFHTTCGFYYEYKQSEK